MLATPVRGHLRRGRLVRRYLKMVPSKRPLTQVRIATPEEKEWANEEEETWAVTLKNGEIVLMGIPGPEHGVDVRDLMSHEELHHILFHEVGQEAANRLDDLAYDPKTSKQRSLTSLKMFDLRRGRHGGV